jgi:hypothetical protein
MARSPPVVMLISSPVVTDQTPPENERPTPEKLSVAMICLRYVLPALVVIGGVVVMALGSETDVEGGAGIAGAGLAIYAMNWLIRKASDDRERAQEEAAREFFDAHGRWPDEVDEPEHGAAPTASPVPSASAASASAHASPTQLGVSAERRLERPAIPRSRGSHDS